MTASGSLLQQGVTALQQKRYSDAIQALKSFCATEATPQSKEFYQAQMWLVRAYQESGKREAAIALCQQMATTPQPQVRAWASKILPTLTTTSGNSERAPEAVTAPPPEPAQRLPHEESARLIKVGNQALKLQRFAEAVTALEAFCQGTDPSHKDYAQAQMWLAKAYKGNDQEAAAIALGKQLLTHEKEYVQIWAKEFLNKIAPAVVVEEQSEEPTAEPEGEQANPAMKKASQPSQPRRADSPAKAGQSIPKAGRSPRKGVKLGMKGVAASLSLASGVTLSLLFGMVLVLALALMLIAESENPTLGLAIALGFTIVFNLAMFLISPVIMDLLQNWLYGTRWITLYEVERSSPEAARVIREVCQQKKIKEPRLGLIEDNNPTAFTYGSLPNSARLVVSRGIFKYLDDDEIATVYAHELGHIVHWDFAVMTLAATLVQITYLIYTWVRELADKGSDSKIGNAARSVAIAAYIFYLVGEYLMLYLSRTREYYADNFAAEITGNPNALSRGLVKIAYGIMEEGKRNTEPSKMLQGTRALGIADPRSATLTGTAYRVAADPNKVGRVFLWDMFNPWAWWMELNSTHPLTGKRVRALSTYAEQLGIDAEFDMVNVVREGRKLNKKKLYGNFTLDVFLLWADWICCGVGLLLGGGMVALGVTPGKALAAALLGLGIGTLLKMVFMYPDFSRAPATDVLSLMSDPYASPLRGRAVKLEGEVIGRGDAGYLAGSDLKLQDKTGLVYLRYASRFGPVGNFFFGLSQADSFINQEVSAVGWFRRGVMPWVDLVKLDCPNKWNITSYPRFWLLVKGILCIVGGIVLPSFL